MALILAELDALMALIKLCPNTMSVCDSLRSTAVSLLSYSLDLETPSILGGLN